MIMTHVDLIEKLLKYVELLRISSAYLLEHFFAYRWHELTIFIDTTQRNETRRRLL